MECLRTNSFDMEEFVQLSKCAMFVAVRYDACCNLFAQFGNGLQVLFCCVIERKRNAELHAALGWHIPLCDLASAVLVVLGDE